MTTTPALPEWEAELRDYGAPPAINKERLRDPAYMLARIQEALGKAADARGAARSDISGRIELASLHFDLRRIAAELKLQTAAADELLAVLTELHPQIHWFRGSSGFGGFPGKVGDSNVAERCALRLRLTEGPPADSGRRWTGVIETFRVTVFEQ